MIDVYVKKTFINLIRQASFNNSCKSFKAVLKMQIFINIIM